MSIKDKHNQVQVRVVKASTSQTAGGSGQILDPFEDMYETNGLLEPPYTPLDFAKMPETTNILQPLIDAYKTNITGFGYNFKYAVDIESPLVDQGIKDKAQKDWITLKAFYDNCHFDQTFTEITSNMIDDRERIGWGCIEVIPGANGAPIAFEYIPAHTIRLSKQHPDPQTIPVQSVDMAGKRLTVNFVKRFRKFCQLVESTNTKVWFKEFGDPRQMDKFTGQFDVELDASGKPVKTKIDPANYATSIVYFPLHCPYSPYGVPRWIGNLLSITGSRKSEELNFNYFNKGKHIPLAILVKNGSLTESSIDLLQEYASNIEGTDNAHGYLVLEVSSFDDETGLDDKPQNQTDIKFEHLTDTIQNDGLFQDYDQSCRDKTRAGFRLPPIYTGESKDYTRATADTARAIAEEQIFNPERETLAHKFNQLINYQLGVLYARMYFKSPNLSNKLELANAVNIYAKTGVLTPNMLIEAVSDLLGQDFEHIQEDWGNKPMQMVLAELNGKKIAAKETDPNATPDPNADPTDPNKETDPVEGGDTANGED